MFWSLIRTTLNQLTLPFFYLDNLSKCPGDMCLGGFPI